VNSPIETVVEALSSHHCQPKKNGIGYKALCPSHEDRIASLSVTEGDDGKVLLKCFAGCEHDRIASALGLEVKDLFAGDRPDFQVTHSRNNHKSKTKPPKEPDKNLRPDIESAIVSCCELLKKEAGLQKRLLETRGITLNTARRFGIGYDGQRARWSIPIRDHEGVKAIGLKYHRASEDQEPKGLSEPGSQVGLFGFDTITDKNAPLVVTEGEFDAMVIYQSTGINAVSGSGGAATVKTEWSGLLAGHPVILCLDNDSKGREATEKWKALLGPLVLGGRIPSLRIVSEYPAGCKDATDILLRHGAEAVRRTIDSAVSWEPSVTFSLCTDLANAERFSSQHRENVRYCFTQNSWLVWNGKVWERDAEGAVTELAKRTVRSIYDEAGKAPTKEQRSEISRHARASESRRAIVDMLTLARSERGIPIRQERLDSERWLLPLQNGTYDLKEDLFREHRREDYFTRLAPVSFDGEADCPRFLEFLQKIMSSFDQDGRDRVIAFLQKLFGICLTGDVGCQRIFILWGGGQNGKSTLINTILGVLGPFATRIDTEILLQKNYSQHPTGLTDLYGTRLAWTSETGDGRRLAEDQVKSLTGGDNIRARRMRENFFEWQPSHKLLLLTNSRPSIRGRDFAIWRRICLIPFTYKIPPEERIDNYENILLEERSGILNWCLDGLRAYRENGLSEPEEVRSAVQQYQQEEDILAPWLEERCLLGPDYHTPAAVVRESYEAHCQERAVEPIGKPTFWRLLTELGIEASKQRGSRYRDGIGIKVDSGITDPPSGRLGLDSGTVENEFSV